MRPAPSIILFTTLSGAGYGLLLLVSLLSAGGQLPRDGATTGIGLLLALLLIGAGLGSSLFHLGRPERAWRAFSQWRSSWLSREGVAALATFAPALLLTGLWLGGAGAGLAWAILAGLAALGATATVLCTGMIYASLKPVRQWHTAWVPVGYLAFALATGALWLTALARCFDGQAAVGAVLAAAAVLLAWAVKLAYWRAVGGADPVASRAAAIGLTAPIAVRPLDAPHTEENYLLHEMGYKVARKHARKLRRLALTVGAALTALLCLAAASLPGAGGAAAAVLALLLGQTAVLIERWLFFAEARHAVTLYYGHGPG